MIPTVSPFFLSAHGRPFEARIVLLGVPFDGTSSFRPGSRFGPRVLRAWSEVLETYSPAFDRDLADVSLADWGDLDIPIAGWDKVGARVEEAVALLLEGDRIPFLLGGEHLITEAAVRACLARHPDLAVLQMDAHLDLRKDHQGDPHSHATVMRRIHEMTGKGRLFQWGVRSGTREEWEWARREGTLVTGMEEVRRKLGVRPLYLSIDLDVLDPSVFPDTGTPEPGGITFQELSGALQALRGVKVVGADVMEFSPRGDMGGASGAAAAKTVREAVFLCDEGRGASASGKGAGRSSR